MFSAAAERPRRSAVRWSLAAAAALAVLKCWAALRLGDGALLAQGAYSASGLLLFLASWPWFAPDPSGCRQGDFTYASRSGTLLPPLLTFGALFATGLVLLWRAAAFYRPGPETAAAAGILTPAVIILLIMAQLALFRAVNTARRRQKSLALAAISINLRADLLMLGGVLAAAAAAQSGYPAGGVLVSAGIGILILIRALEPVYLRLTSRDGVTLRPAAPGIVLAPVRERAAGVNGVASVCGARALRENGRIALWLEIGITDDTPPDQSPRVGEAVTRAVAENFHEVSAVNTRPVPLSVSRNLLLQSRQIVKPDKAKAANCKR